MISTTPLAEFVGTGAVTAPQVLQAEHFDLWGSRLIEASAGTGKTWTIAALYLRLVLGHGAQHAFTRALRPNEILVMTFTRAATRELSDRIRARLLVAAQCFRSDRPVDPDDDFLAQLLADYAPGLARDRAAWLLDMAAQSMDDASVHTIDAWCQRMLREHAFDSACLFDEELVVNEEALRLEAMQDYWRQSCYPLTRDALAQVSEVWSGLEALVRDMQGLLDQELPADAGEGTLAALLARAGKQRQQRLSELKAGWAERADTMLDWIHSQMPAKAKGWSNLRLADFERWLASLKTWALGQDDTPLQESLGATAWERLTPQGLEKVRSVGAPPIQLPDAFAAFAALRLVLAELPEVRVAVRLHAAATISRRILQRKRQTGSFGFADMLTRLDAALDGANGERLRERILAQYPVVLIDEFQDTSPLQYRIFDRIYRTAANDPASALLLIGDPKQSIYGFRGADIYSYMRARRATSGRHYVLETNFRSTQALVGVVNHWFESAEQARPAGAFMYRKPGDDPLPYLKVHAKGRSEQLLVSGAPLPAMTLVQDVEVRTAEEARKRFAAQCAEQIVLWLNDRSAVFSERHVGAGQAATLSPLRPADIAVLVRTGKEAAAVRRELARRSVASVYLSDKESVLQSAVASDLVHWLRAVEQPKDARLLRAGLATASLGLTLQELADLASDEDRFEQRSAQLQQLHGVWRTQGALAMLRQTLHQFNLASRWLHAQDGERHLTNFLHLAELLQRASAMLEGEQALIRWLVTAVTQAGHPDDEQIVRLESDDDLVKVVTIHKSKGLEYGVVCLPFATSFRKMDKRSASFVKLADETGAQSVRLQFTPEELDQADRERLREDLRLLYVALTRARHGLWVGFSALRSGRSQECVSHHSGAGYLLAGEEPLDQEAWQAQLAQFAGGCSQVVLQTAASLIPCTPLQTLASAVPLPSCPDYQAQFERDWRIGSFSQWVRDLSPALPGSELSPLQAARPADDEPDAVPAFEHTGVDAPAVAVGSSSPWHQFPRGAEAGNFLHAQLEWLAHMGFDLQGHAGLSERIRQRCDRAGHAAHADTLVLWLGEVVQTRMAGPQVSLSDVQTVLPEMEFWLPVKAMAAPEVDALCCRYLLQGLERPALARRQLHGMLMGFADLVFEHQGKYWVLDYKSNHLGDDDAAYDQEALRASMVAHRYDVQAALYLLALHRLLKDRLGDNYHPEQQLGGAVYLFLRGIKGPAGGVCYLPASLALLHALEAMLEPQQAPA